MNAELDDHLGPPDTRSGIESETERRRRRARAARSRRRGRVRVGVVVIAGLSAAIVLISLASRGGSHVHASSASTHLARRSAGTPTASVHTSVALGPQPARHLAVHHRSAPSPGSLPQTEAFPSAHTALFHSLMASLWSGITANSVADALPAFFPKKAYVQLKAIVGAESDWGNRLVHDYALDIAAAHALLGSEPQAARLVRVQVPSSYGHWVPPGVCDNGIGYYEVPNARVVYRQHGEERSFGIASMISWRGVWYVVHLGAILRPGERGEVDEPASGPGASAYSGTC